MSRMHDQLFAFLNILSVMRYDDLKLVLAQHLSRPLLAMSKDRIELARFLIVSEHLTTPSADEAPFNVGRKFLSTNSSLVILPHCYDHVQLRSNYDDSDFDDLVISLASFL